MLALLQIQTHSKLGELTIGGVPITLPQTQKFYSTRRYYLISGVVILQAQSPTKVLKRLSLNGFCLETLQCRFQMRRIGGRSQPIQRLDQTGQLGFRNQGYISAICAGNDDSFTCFYNANLLASEKTSPSIHLIMRSNIDEQYLILGNELKNQAMVISNTE